MELTAPPRSFTSSLATAQDPALISENRPALLTTGPPISVLGMAQQPNSGAARTTSFPAPHSSRQWMPPLNVQRAALGAVASSPPPTLPLMSSDAIEPYVGGAMSSGSLVEATDPAQPRVVPIVDHVEPSGPSPVVAEGPSATAAQRSVESAAPAPSAHPHLDVASVQPIVESSGDVPTEASALQRSAVDGTVVPIPAASAAPRPALARSVVSAAQRTALDATTPAAVTPHHNARATPPLPLPATIPPSIPAAVAPSAHTVVNTLQRNAVGDVDGVEPTVRPIDSPPTPALMQRVAADADTASAVGVQRSAIAVPLAPRIGGSARVQPQPISDGPAVSAVQRSVGGPAEAAAGIRAATGAVTGEVPRTALTTSEAGVEFPASPAGFSVPVEVQRSTAHIDAGDSTHHTFATPAGRLSTTKPQLAAQTDNPASAAVTAAPLSQPDSTAVPTAQRSAVPESRSASLAQPIAALPVLQRAKDAESGNAPVSVSTAMTTSSAGVPTAPPPVDGPSLPGRIVLLPPVRTETREGLADSAQPMSLQRMFGDFGQPATDSRVGRPRGHDEPPTVPTMTLDAPTAQREVESAPDPITVAQRISEHSLAEEAAPVQAASAPAPAPAPAPAQAPTNVDELVGRLYEPLAARLRAELWLDRERAGALMNLHR
ncbi:hypothetical protein [Mycobacterium sp. AZCC_0083]|uniref:hypothetical protein n=1 Tax=Mycobacterium sp. AZCC_0083 TaxID=2735882 RepID=UPI001618C95F|nr:hypothetical protein [Mycobacterium sp. AZCC_0083]MBB5166966.1 hypothetical protein [Mycobacterium sp. AZCC_0083]